jgi:hypothetical protein
MIYHLYLRYYFIADFGLSHCNETLLSFTNIYFHISVYEPE